jgi:hypothetical protein
LTLTYRQTAPPFKYVTVKLNLADLAGSEDNRKTGNTGTQLVESSAINLSLLTLRKVVAAINEGKTQIPFRESKLTRLLQDSLGGSSQAIMISNVSPFCSHFQETFKALEFSRKTRTIVNRPVTNQASIYASEEEKKYNERLMRTGFANGNDKALEGCVTKATNVVEARRKNEMLNVPIPSGGFATKEDIKKLQQLLQPKQVIGGEILERVEKMEKELNAVKERNMKLEKENNTRFAMQDIQLQNREKMGVVRKPERDNVSKILFGGKPKNTREFPGSGPITPPVTKVVEEPQSVSPIFESPESSITDTPRTKNLKNVEAKDLASRVNEYVREKRYDRALLLLEQIIRLKPENQTYKDKYEICKRKLANQRKKQENTEASPDEKKEVTGLREQSKPPPPREAFVEEKPKRSNLLAEKRARKRVDDESDDERPLKKLKRTVDKENAPPVDSNIISPEFIISKTNDKQVTKKTNDKPAMVEDKTSIIAIRVNLLKYINNDDNGEKELKKLHSVGAATAKKIIENRPFTSLNDLTSIGISDNGVKNLVKKNEENIWELINV